MEKFEQSKIKSLTTDELNTLIETLNKLKYSEWLRLACCVHKTFDRDIKKTL